MTQIPFPAQIAARSARAAAEIYERHRDKPQDVNVVEGIACFRLPGGDLQMCEDLYRPHCPEGATPGLGTVQLTIGRRADGKSTYEADVVDFVPSESILACENIASATNPLSVSPVGVNPVRGQCNPWQSDAVEPQDPFAPISSRSVKPYERASNVTEEAERESLLDMQV